MSEARETEIAPAMIEAGAEQLRASQWFIGLEDTARLIVAEVYRAMEAARGER